MLKVTIELFPHGQEVGKKIISELFIGNTLKKNKYNEYTYKYHGWVEHEPCDDKKLNEMFGKHEFSGTVEHDRRNIVYLLLYRIINKIIKPYGHYGIDK
jgi:hypothetical protein